MRVFFSKLFYSPRADEIRLEGLNIARNHCAQSHVIDESNKFGGIGSTPRFQLIVVMEDRISRFENFYERGPHPVFVRDPGVLRWLNVPPYATEFVITLKVFNNFLVFIKTIKKKDFPNAPVIGKYRNSLQKPFLK